MTAETLMLIGGVTAFLLTVYWVRSRDIREKYAVGWVAVAGLLLLLGVFPELIMGFAARAHLSYPAAVLFVALTLIYLFSFTVSVSLSHLYRRSVRLTQEMALLKERLQQFEKLVGPGPAAREGRGAGETGNGRERL
jgi:hypothetical protein